jgi:hypothetical protein
MLDCFNTYYKPNTSSPSAMTPSKDGRILAVADANSNSDTLQATQYHRR